MSDGRDNVRGVRAELAEHLRALRELGVTELRLPAPRPKASAPPRTAPSAPARPGTSAGARGAGGSGAETAEAAGLPAVSMPPRAEGPEIVRKSRQDGLFSGIVGGGGITRGGSIEAPVEGDPAELLEQLRSEEIGECVRCKLSGGRKTIVFGSGSPSARLMFVGEGPGADEDAQGLPFVGRAGQLLTKMIESMVVGGRKLARDEVYIANIIKCRPPGNRDPEPDEIAACEGFLFGQIAIIQPRVIVALGAFAARTLLRSKAPISALRGRFHEYRGTLLMPTFHPAYILRNYTEDTRRTVYQDLKKVAAELESAS